MCRSGKGLKIKNIILDRDGTIIKDKKYLKDPKEVEFIKNSKEALKRLCQKGANLFIITNQSGIGRGYFTVKDYLKVKEKIHLELKKEGILIKDELFCPHSPDENCDCRKPKIGMWKELKKKHDLKEEESVIIGDKISDIEFGYNANLRFKILVFTGYGKEEAKKIGIFKTLSKQPYEEIKDYKSFSLSNIPNLISKDLFCATIWLEKYL